MKKYDISDNFRSRVHTIRVTFQWQEYKGHIAYEMYGNCRGQRRRHPPQPSEYPFCSPWRGYP